MVANLANIIQTAKFYPQIPYSPPSSFLAEEPGESSHGLLRMEASESLLLDQRLVVVDVVAVLVAERGVVAPALPELCGER